MWFFNGRANNSSKDVINSSEYERLAVRISDIAADVKAVKADHELLKTDIANLRGKFNQRLKGLIVDEEKPKEKEIETINNTEFVAFG